MRLVEVIGAEHPRFFEVRPRPIQKTIQVPRLAAELMAGDPKSREVIEQALREGLEEIVEESNGE